MSLTPLEVCMALASCTCRCPAAEHCSCHVAYCMIVLDQLHLCIGCSLGMGQCVGGALVEH